MSEKEYFDSNVTQKVCNDGNRWNKQKKLHLHATFGCVTLILKCPIYVKQALNESIGWWSGSNPLKSCVGQTFKNVSNE